MDDFSRMINNLTLLNEVELEALAKACCERVDAKKKARREGQRRELMNEIRTAINEALNNGFELTIENEERDIHDDYACINLIAGETYSLNLE